MFARRPYFNTLFAVATTCAITSNLHNPAIAIVLHGTLSQTSSVPEGTTGNIRQPLPALNGFDGAWDSSTAVLSSSVPFVQSGASITSRVRFVRLPDASLAARWKQDGWTRSREQLTSLSETEAYISRINMGLGQNAGYIATSHDYYKQNSATEIQVSSTVNLFAGNIYLGTYTTSSTLHPAAPNINGLCHHRH